MNIRVGLSLAVVVAAAVAGLLVSGSAAAPPPDPAAAYVAIADAGNARLDRDFDALEDSGGTNLAAAQADLLDVAATEHRFDHDLSALTLPPETASTVHFLFVANESRAELSAEAARSTTPAQLQAYQRQLDAANAPVEQAVTDLRHELGLPPPETS
jgi:hypothetical protein